MITATVAVLAFLVSSTGERDKRGTQCGEIDLEQVSPANTIYPVILFMQVSLQSGEAIDSRRPSGVTSKRKIGNCPSSKIITYYLPSMQTDRHKHTNTYIQRHHCSNMNTSSSGQGHVLSGNTNRQGTSHKHGANPYLHSQVIQRPGTHNLPQVPE